MNDKCNCLKFGQWKLVWEKLSCLLFSHCSMASNVDASSTNSQSRFRLWLSNPGSMNRDRFIVFRIRNTPAYFTTWPEFIFNCKCYQKIIILLPFLLLQKLIDSRCPYIILFDSHGSRRFLLWINIESFSC